MDENESATDRREERLICASLGPEAVNLRPGI